MDMMERARKIQRTAKGGFTLLELLIVVIIVGILASVAIPQFSDFVEKSRGAEALVNLDAIRTGALAYELEVGTPAADIDVLGSFITIVDTDDWDFTFSGGLATATKARDPNNGNTITMDAAGVIGGNWPFRPQ